MNTNASDTGPVGAVPNSTLTTQVTTETIRTIGGYRIVREIGRGGMGVIYEAQQLNPQRAVALKIVKGGAFVGEQQVKLFQREAQALARLKHPYVAAIYEAGRTPDGQHFFAMELVRGQPLHEHARRHNLSLADRLELFCKVCDAVNYAHQRGVMHRDLKPSNVLIDDRGNPKLLDFGLARITDADVAVTTVVSELGQVLGTLSYMSPEQTRGNPDEIDLRTDVYSLGVILYELLTGRLPYDLGSGILLEAVRVICDDPPRRLSTIVRSLRGDLETIALKSLDKDPGRRYQSVAALADDIRRYLTDQPILARPPSAVYQIKKLVARHKVPFAFLGLLALLTLGAGIWMGVLYAETDRLRITAEQDRTVALSALDKAETESEKAVQVQQFLQDMLAAVDPTKAKGRDTTVLRELLDEAALKVDTELNHQPEVRAAVQHTIGSTYLGLGSYVEAEKHLQASLSTRRQLYGEDNLDVAVSLNALGILMQDKGQSKDAERLYRKALEIRRRLADADDKYMADSLNNLATALHDRGEFDEAEDLYRQALDLRRRLFGSEHADVAQSIANLALLLQHRGQLDEAESLHRQALDMRRRLLEPSHPAITQTLNNLAVLLYRQENYLAAETHLREVLTLRRQWLGSDHPNIAKALNNLAEVLWVQDKTKEAEECLRQAVIMRRELLGDDHPHTLLSMRSLAEVLQDRQALQEAETLYRQVLSIERRRSAQRGPGGVISTLNVLAALLRDQDRASEARALAEESWQLAKESPAGNDQSLGAAGTLLGLIVTDAGQANEAEPVLRQSLQARRRSLPAEHWLIANTQSILGGCLAAQGRYAEAEPLVVESFDAIRQEHGEDGKLTLQALERIVNLYEAWGKPHEKSRWKQALHQPQAPKTTSQ